MKKFMILICVVMLLTVAMFAAGPRAAPSCNGAAHGAFANVNGNFGFLGEVGGTPGYHDGAVGQDSGATGYNNSTASATCNGN